MFSWYEYFIRIGPAIPTEKEMIETAKRKTAGFIEWLEFYRQQQEKIMVRAKFCLTGVHFNYGESRQLTFEPRYDESIEEDKRFAKATPNGRFEMTCDNPKALSQFELGKTYYFDISSAE